MLHAVILAGGGGTRLWPLSTAARPKQYLPLTGQKSILEMTVERASSFVPLDRIWIVTTQEQMPLVEALGTGVPSENILREPMGRNTAPCIGLASVRLRERDQDATMLVLPADHLIRDVDAFQSCVNTAVEHTEAEGGLVTFGITPSRPETGYGYIHAAAEPGPSGAYTVVAFKEKPDAATALQFVKSGDYFWNSGMFVWKAATILDMFASCLPTHHSILSTIGAVGDGDARFAELYGSMEAISIDYGILEHADNVAMVRGDFDWSDVGGFEELQRISEKDEEGNHVEGHVLLEGVTDSYVKSSDPRPVAVIGLEGVTVVVNEDGILISRTTESQKAKLASQWSNENAGKK
ncbi:mannose-1-phosphate guanylyltransferase [bacterium]|nr:mannose-1-phosphate guanylyltransferase [bacterium]